MPTYSGLSAPLLPPPDPDSDNQAYYDAQVGGADAPTAYLVVTSRLDDPGVDVVVAPPDPGDGTDAPLLFRAYLPFGGEVCFLAAGTAHDALGGLVVERDAVLLKLGPEFAELDALLPEEVPAPAAIVLEGIDADTFRARLEAWSADDAVVSRAFREEAWYRVHGREVADENPVPGDDAVSDSFVQAVMDAVVYVWLPAETRVGSLEDLSFDPVNLPYRAGTLTVRSFGPGGYETSAAWLLDAFGNAELALGVHPIVEGVGLVMGDTIPQFHLVIQYFEVTASEEGERRPLVGATVDVVDRYDEFNVLASGTTNGQGVPLLEWGGRTARGESFYFRIQPPHGFEIVLQNHELKDPRRVTTADRPWKTTAQWTDDGQAGDYIDFAGYQLGTQDAPLVFCYGVPVEIDFVLVTPKARETGNRIDPADAYSSRTRAFPRGIRVNIYQKDTSEDENDILVDTFWTDQHGRVRGVSLVVQPGVELDVAVESTLRDPTIGITDEFVVWEQFDPTHPDPGYQLRFVAPSSRLEEMGETYHLHLQPFESVDVAGIVRLDWRARGDRTSGSLNQVVAAFSALADYRRVQEALYVLLDGEPTQSVLPTRTYVTVVYGEGPELTADARTVPARDPAGVLLVHPTAGVQIYCTHNRFNEKRWWDAVTLAHEYGHAVYFQLVGYTNEGNPDLPTGVHVPFPRTADLIQPHWHSLASTDFTAIVEGYADAFAAVFGDFIDWFTRLDASGDTLPYKERVRVDLRVQPGTVAQTRRLCEDDGRRVEGCIAEALWGYVGDPRGDLGLSATSKLPSIKLNAGILVSETLNHPLVDAYPALANATVRQAFQAVYWRALIEVGKKSEAQWVGRTSNGASFPSPYDYLVHAKAQLDALRAAGYTGPDYARWKSAVLVPWHLEYTGDGTKVDTDSEVVTC